MLRRRRRRRWLRRRSARARGTRHGGERGERVGGERGGVGGVGGGCVGGVGGRGGERVGGRWGASLVLIGSISCFQRIAEGLVQNSPTRRSTWLVSPHSRRAQLAVCMRYVRHQRAHRQRRLVTRADELDRTTVAGLLRRCEVWRDEFGACGGTLNVDDSCRPCRHPRDARPHERAHAQGLGRRRVPVAACEHAVRECRPAREAPPVAGRAHVPVAVVGVAVLLRSARAPMHGYTLAAPDAVPVREHRMHVVRVAMVPVVSELRSTEQTLRREVPCVHECRVLSHGEVAQVVPITTIADFCLELAPIAAHTAEASFILRAEQHDALSLGCFVRLFRCQMWSE